MPDSSWLVGLRLAAVHVDADSSAVDFQRFVAGNSAVRLTGILAFDQRCPLLRTPLDLGVATSGCRKGVESAACTT